jgi:hypothetical protein
VHKEDAGGSIAEFVFRLMSSDHRMDGDSDIEDDASAHPAALAAVNAVLAAGEAGAEAAAAPVPLPTTLQVGDASAVAPVCNTPVDHPPPLQMSSRNHVMVETDWNVSMTAARAAAYTGLGPLVSAPFTCFGTSFRLELTPNDKSAARGVSLRVRSMGPVHRVHLRSALAEIYVKKSPADQLECSKRRHWTPPTKNVADWDARIDMRDGTAVGWTPLVKQADLEAKERTHFISHDDTMCLHVELYFYAASMLPNSASLGSDLSQLRRLENTCDARFVLRDGRELRAHLAVLCARSPYFRALVYGENFTKNPSKDGQYDATEFEERAFELFLDMSYSDDQRILEGASAETVLEVLRIADLYCVDTVRSMCDSHLAYGATLSAETCGTLLGTAHRMGWSALKRSAIEFLKRNKAVVIETRAFAKCLTENPDLAIEIMRCV